MNDMNLLSHRIKKIHGRLSDLYQSAVASASPSPDLLPTALVELGIVSEALQLVMEELVRQNESLTFMQGKVEAERQRYQHLLELIPNGYLVTDIHLTIQEANRAAAHLFNTQQQNLIGKSLPTLVLSDDRPSLQAKLSQINQRHRIELSTRFQRYYSDAFSAAASINIVHNPSTDSLSLYWLLRDVTDRRRVDYAMEWIDYNPCEDRPMHYYNKGEIIPLEPNQLWLVSQGVVKLSTLSERGDEMLIGLMQESMVFGSSLTALQTYEAIALTKVQLVSIPLSEISQSPQLSQALLPLISQRLRQTESFLSIYGQLRVEDRLQHLLRLLKREIGQPTENGTCLRVRLTHQDFASVCCTTRVTITRLLGKLQQEGKITFDAHNHLLLKE